ncbi:MAG: hypothetical protein Q9209_002668 [Squamulea sp. 1 TL-2023]
MPSSEALTDEYVAQLIAKDARDRTIKYSSYGLQAILPKRPTTNAPKPNTRFLKNIIKETDSHNAALRAKEIADARLRLRGINGNGSQNGGHREERWRDEDGRSTKKRRLGWDEDEEHPDKDVEGITKITTLSPRWSAPAIVDTIGDGAAGVHLPTAIEVEDEDQGIDTAHAQIPEQDQDQHHQEKTNIHTAAIDLTTKDATPPLLLLLHPLNDHPITIQTTHPFPHPQSTPTRPPSNPSSASDSDPLTSLIGPLPPSTNQKHKPPTPPPILRGRGTNTLTTSSSAIDTHFTSTYNPTLDIAPTALEPHEEDDWDNALEALRDRAKWRSSGAERLRAAGFTEEEVKKWEKSGTGDREGREEDVRWTGRGEGREWDRGKVVGDDGVQVEVEWGRLKGT